MRQAPKPSELMSLVSEAKAKHENHIRFEVAPSKHFMDRQPRIWDGVTVRTVGRRMEEVQLVNGTSIMVTEALIVEAHVATITEAARREQMRDLYAAGQPLRVNQVQQQRIVVGPR